MHYIVESATYAPLVHLAWKIVWDITRYCLEQRRKKPVALPSA